MSEHRPDEKAGSVGDRASNGARHSDVRIPLSIGVAVDDDLATDSLASVYEPLAGLLAELRDRYPSTPLVLLSPPASAISDTIGRLAAEVGARVIGIDEQIIGPAQRMNDKVSANVSAEENAAWTAAVLAEHCHFVVGITQHGGLPASPLVGKTVAFRMEGIPDRYASIASVLDRAGIGRVFHIALDAGNSDKDGGSPTCRWLSPPDEASSGGKTTSDLAIWDDLETFNRDAADYCRGAGVSPAGPAADPRPASGCSGCPAAAPQQFAWIQERFEIADLLAVRFQRLTHRTALSLLVLGCLAIVAFQGSLHFPTATVLYAALLALAYGWYEWSRGRRYERRFQDYRALAEGLRVQMHWHRAGLAACAADHYLRRQRSDLEWIRQALRTYKLAGHAGCGVPADGGGAGVSPAGPAAAPAGPAAGTAAPRDVIDAWVNSQWEFYTQKTLANHRADVRIGAVKTCIFLLGVLLAAAKPLLHGGDSVTQAIAATAVVAGLLHVYARTRAFAEQAQQYRRMAQLFGEARTRLRQFLEENDESSCRLCLLELGKEALAEHGDWLLLHRERPISFETAPAWISGPGWLVGYCFRHRPWRKKPASQLARIADRKNNS